jgi:hypothetical protein
VDVSSGALGGGGLWVGSKFWWECFESAGCSLWLHVKGGREGKEDKNLLCKCMDSVGEKIESIG